MGLREADSGSSTVSRGLMALLWRQVRACTQGEGNHPIWTAVGEATERPIGRAGPGLFCGESQAVRGPTTWGTDRTGRSTGTGHAFGCKLKQEKNHAGIRNAFLRARK